jgi:hypothetical protein
MSVGFLVKDINGCLLVSVPSLGRVVSHKLSWQQCSVKCSQAHSCILWVRSTVVAGTICIIRVLVTDLELVVSEMLIDLYHLTQLLA